MQRSAVIPVLVIDGGVYPMALAETLVAAGLPVIEVIRSAPSVTQAAFFRSFPFGGGIIKQRLSSALAARGI